MNAFSDIDSLLRVISREKDILRFLFVSRKAPSLRPEQALENFLEEDLSIEVFVSLNSITTKMALSILFQNAKIKIFQK